MSSTPHHMLLGALCYTLSAKVLRPMGKVLVEIWMQILPWLQVVEPPVSQCSYNEFWMFSRVSLS